MPTVPMGASVKTRIFPALTDREIRQSVITGYTLLELLVVLAIMAGVMAVIPRAYAALSPSYELRQTVNRLAYALQLAREDARAEGAPRRVEIISESGSVLLPDGEAMVFDGMAIAFEADGPWSDTDAVTFHAGGMSTGGRIILTNGPARTELVVNWATGALEVLR